LQAGKFDEMEDESIRRKQDPTYAEQLQQIRDELKGGGCFRQCRLSRFLFPDFETLLPWLLV
jgi:hypothetical protein